MKIIDLLQKYNDIANYMCVAQMYLKDNVFLNKKLEIKDLKEKVSGHFGNVSQINFVYSHLNYFAKKYHLNVGFIIGSGHAGLTLAANLWIEGTFTKFRPYIDFTTFISSFGQEQGLRSEINPEYMGTVYDGGELGYSLGVTFGSVLRSKNIVFCLVGDGEAETGSISSAWQLNKFLDYKKDGIVVPILNLNGYKMGNKSLFSSFSRKKIKEYFFSLNYKPYFVGYNHKQMISVLRCIKKDIDNYFIGKLSKFPLIVLTIEKGFTAPDYIGFSFSGKLNSHKNPLPNLRRDVKELEYLEHWLQSYNVHNLEQINFSNYFVDILPENKIGEFFLNNFREEYSTKDLVFDCENNFPNIDKYVNELCKETNLIVVSPDELISNKFIITHSNNNCIEILNENLCQCILQGLINRGKHCLFIAYEAFMPIIAGMFDQLCKFINERKKYDYYQPLPSANYFLTSLCWENCYSHQNPDFINIALNKSFDFVNVYFPLDAYSTILCIDKCNKSSNLINIIVKSKINKGYDLTKSQALSLVRDGYIWLKEDKNGENLLICIGDSLIESCLNAEKQYKKVDLLYVYNLRFIKHLKPLKNYKKIVIVFHGYTSCIKNLIFENLKDFDVRILGFTDACSRGNLEHKIKDNKVSTDYIIKEFKN